MKNGFLIKIFCILALAVLCGAKINTQPFSLSDKARKMLAGKQILYVERHQYASDHHNTATIFQYGEINQNSFSQGGAIKIYDVDSGKTRTLINTDTGNLRDPEISFDGKRVIFSMRMNKEDDYHIYEIGIDGSNLKQLTSAKGVSDIDPLYLPDGGIVFTSTRQPKYCMCNRHIMGNLFRMESDGANITQIGVSTLFEGHSTMLNDGRILYDRWEYVDRNFGDAQGLWTVNPDGTKHSIYYGNNTASPGAVIDGRQIPGTDLVLCIFSSCHDRPWGSLAIIDRKKGVDGKEPVVKIYPEEALNLVANGDLDTFKWVQSFRYEDPFPMNKEWFLVSRTLYKYPEWNNQACGYKQGIFLVGMDGSEELLIEGERSVFDPHIVESSAKPVTLPMMRNFTSDKGQFYVVNVYEGTHMQGIEKGVAKWLRVIESPEKRSWTHGGWSGQGEQAPALNWHSFENKQILGEVPIEEDGSVNFMVPAGKHVYFQLLDKDKKMIQSMRSGVSLMPGEVNGCVGCHEDRISILMPTPKRPIALTKKPVELEKFMGMEPFKFSFMEHVQPIMDRRCVKCHDFDKKNRQKVVLAKDMNQFFNAAYINLYVNKVVGLIGGGPADIQQPYSWGSHNSRLSQIIEGDHHGVKLTQKEKEWLYAWMDLNGVYYPVYESAFDNTLSGRSPLTYAEIDCLSELTGVNLRSLNTHTRTLQAQISFDRPAESPILDGIRNDKSKYDVALALIELGSERLKNTPRGDIERDLVPCQRHEAMLKKYDERIQNHKEVNNAISSGGKIYDRDQQ
ncbi:MAG: hypothetical protein IKY25_07855 [Alistipes sp.]|jgi:hypothetical protein|nr:hypothetical protein [Alistipes sp.]MBR5802643.1 hypothetical protein [Alistipes sp.]